MRLTELTFKPTAQVLAMTDQERHELLKFIHDWLAGTHMKSGDTKPQSSNLSDDALLSKWQQIAQMFPPNVPKKVNLFRLVTIPIAYTKQQHFTFKPAPRKVSSWTRTLTGLDAVAGIATDMLHNYGNYQDKIGTARIGIEATLPGNLVLATPISIRNAFMTLSHDYFDRYKEVSKKVTDPKHRHFDTWVTSHPGYPGGDDDLVSDFNMNDVDFLHDVLNRPGGNYHQYEYVVQTPPKIDATVVQIYRVSDKEIRAGNDDPHNFSGRWPTVRRLKFQKRRV